MGLEYVELLLVLERELKIRIRDEALESFWKERRDAQVQEFANWLDNEIRRQRPSYSGDTLEVVKRGIADATCMHESEITPASWIFRDLRMG